MNKFSNPSSELLECKCLQEPLDVNLTLIHANTYSDSSSVTVSHIIYLRFPSVLPGIITVKKQ